MHTPARKAIGDATGEFQLTSSPFGQGNDSNCYHRLLYLVSVRQPSSILRFVHGHKTYYALNEIGRQSLKEVAASLDADRLRALTHTRPERPDYNVWRWMREIGFEFCPYSQLPIPTTVDSNGAPLSDENLSHVWTAFCAVADAHSNPLALDQAIEELRNSMDALAMASYPCEVCGTTGCDHVCRDCKQVFAHHSCAEEVDNLTRHGEFVCWACCA